MNKNFKSILILRCLIIISLGLLSISCTKKQEKIVLNVPEWAKKVVWYQIFPERFRNGDTNNDPKFEDIIGSYPHDLESPWNISPWTSDWYALQSWEQGGQGFYFHAQRRRYGGDLQGVLEKLDYLSDLGINGIYFNPVFESPSLHKYDAASFHHIDDNFGPDPERDKKLIAQEIPHDPHTWQWTTADSLFLQVIRQCHSRGIRVIIDGVWNHIGLNFWAFKDLEKNQKESLYKDWFTVKKWDNPNTPENEFEYKCWWDFKELPEFVEDENGILPGAKEYIFNSVKRWMDPNCDGDPSDGIDGWRLDVAEEVAIPFWRDFRKLVRSINPEAYLVGEIWWVHEAEEKYDPLLWLKGDVFDAVMNYRFTNRTTQFFFEKENKISATQFDSLLSEIRNDYPEETNYVLQNLMDSHDTDRLASMIVNPDVNFATDESRLESNANYKVRKPNADEIQIQKLIATFQMTYLGAPMIYYGDEAGMWGAKDPDERKPMLWNDLKYEDEKSHPFGQKRPKDRNEFNQELFDHYKKLVNIRKNNQPLMLGDFNTLLTDDHKSLYAFLRTYEDEKIVVVLNNSSRVREVKLDLAGSNSWLDLLTGEGYSAKDGMLNVK